MMATRTPDDEPTPDPDRDVAPRRPVGLLLVEISDGGVRTYASPGLYLPYFNRVRAMAAMADWCDDFMRGAASVRRCDAAIFLDLQKYLSTEATPAPRSKG